MKQAKKMVGEGSKACKRWLMMMMRDIAAELESLRKEAEALARIRDAAGTNDYAQIVFNKVFSEDIARLASVEEMWTSRPAPVPLDFTTLEQAAANVDEAKLFNRGPQEEQRVWTPEECLRVFVARYMNEKSMFESIVNIGIVHSD
jgi:hypothetical protein